MDYQEYGKELLEKMLSCNTACVDFNSFKFERPKSPLDKVDFYIKTLPSADYILSQMVNYIFSNSLTTGKIDGNGKLNEFLYRENGQDVTNYSVLKDAIKNAIAYGECGIRWNGNDIYMCETGTYAPLIYNDLGIKRVVGYVATKDGKQIGESVIDLSDFEVKDDITKDLLQYFEDRDWLFLDKSEFRNIRNDTSKLHGESPFLHDELRLELLVTAYERLLHDLNYDGAGRLLMWARSGLVSDDINEMSTSMVMSTSMTSNIEREKKAKQELKKITKDIKESGSDSVILLSNAFDKEIIHLPRVTKATEFLEWLKNEDIIVAQVLGIVPDLLGFGEMSGNVSMEKIIDNAMLNTIVPMREQYAVQFSSFIGNRLGVDKIYFDKYELEQAEDENAMRTKVVNMMSVLASIENPKAQTLVDDFADMLDANIHHDNRELKELKAQKRRDENDKHERDSEQSKRGNTNF